MSEERYIVGGDMWMAYKVIKDTKNEKTYRFSRICKADLRELARLLNDRE
jgi:hypothetical protein